MSANILLVLKHPAKKRHFCAWSNRSPDEAEALARQKACEYVPGTRPESWKVEYRIEGKDAFVLML